MSLDVNKSKEFENIAKAYENAGGDVSNLLQKDIVSIIISGDQILGRNTVEGVEMKAETNENKLKLWLTVKDNVRVPKPIHLCVGYLKEFGEQHLEYFMNIGNNSSANFVSHCSFPAAKNIVHNMVSHLKVGDNSKVTFEDVHFHNEEGLVNLDTTYYADVGKASMYDTRFKLTKTRVGNMKILMEVKLDDDSKAFLETKVREKKDDQVQINEILHLNGERSSGIAKTYIIAQDQSFCKVVNEAYGNGDYSKGHIECTEIVKGDNVNVSTIPVLNVKNDLSELTHEASVGRINSQQLETLMAKGLNEEEATELIIKGVLV